MTTPEPLLAGVELGGTKCIAALARGNRVIERAQWPTGDDAGTTLGAIATWLRAANAAEQIAAIGIASFGPLWLDPQSPQYGRLAETPKPGWSGVDLIGGIVGDLACPVVLDTDVAGAALAEGLWGASRGARSHIYLTIGTGIGGGVVIDGKPHHGTLHPEVGHIRVRRHGDLGFAGVCPRHGDCIEGLASGPAIAARTGSRAELLAPDHPVWPQVAGEIAELVATLILTLVPERIVIGGGVGQGQPGLLPLIRRATADALAGYMPGYDGAALESI
ncbi:MAG TPA: ROK family protein, partial [Novosphingobium sp.]|nr:ROK family protein [Novosphingobium sp.]